MKLLTIYRLRGKLSRRRKINMSMYKKWAKRLPKNFVDIWSTLLTNPLKKYSLLILLFIGSIGAKGQDSARFFIGRGSIAQVFVDKSMKEIARYNETDSIWAIKDTMGLIKLLYKELDKLKKDDWHQGQKYWALVEMIKAQCFGCTPEESKKYEAAKKRFFKLQKLYP